MTRDEAKGIRTALNSFVGIIVDNPAEINKNMAAILPWKPGVFVATSADAPADVCMHGGNPYKCIQSHDSTANPGWTPDTQPALWMQYHGTSKATARPWIQPLGSEDRYRSGEWMIWTDGLAYPCIQDTTYSPDLWPGAWGTPEEI